MHGGLFRDDAVTLDDLRKIDRNRQPPESGKEQEGEECNQDENGWGNHVWFRTVNPRGDAGGLSREYVLRIPSVS